MSKLSINIDKKQMPQIVGLGVLSLGLAGYFSVRLLVPALRAGTASAAATVGTRSLVSAGVRSARGTAALPTTDSTDDLTNGSAPMPGMRDPFIPLVKDDTGTPTKMASALTTPGSLTPVPGLPSAGSVQPLPGFGGVAKPGMLMPLAATIAAPTWTVTGVLGGDDPDADRIAVMRQGDVRRFVHLGSMVDEQYRLIDISRSGVILGVGKTRFRLPLGGAPKTPSAPAATGSPAGTDMPSATASAVVSPTLPPPADASKTPQSPAANPANDPATLPLPVDASKTPQSLATNPANDPFLDSAAVGKDPQ